MADLDKPIDDQSDDLASNGQVYIPTQVPKNEDEITKPVQLNVTAPTRIHSNGTIAEQDSSSPEDVAALALEKAQTQISAEDDTQKVLIFPSSGEQSPADLPATQAVPIGTPPIPAWLMAYLQKEDFAPAEEPLNMDSDTSPIPVNSDSEVPVMSADTAALATAVMTDSHSEWTSEKNLPLEKLGNPDSSTLLAIEQALSDGNFTQAVDMIRQNSADPALREEALKLIRPYLNLDEDRQILWDLNSEFNQLDSAA